MRRRGGSRDDVSAGRAACPCLHHCLGGVLKTWTRLRNRVLRRRNSYTLFIYHTVAAAVSFVLFVLSSTFYNFVWGQIKGPSQECLDFTFDTDERYLSDSGLANLTREGRKATTCTFEIGFPACGLRDLRNLMDFMLCVGVACCLQWTVSLALAGSFRFFSNLPQERLQFGKATRWTAFLGGVCKWMPWATRALHMLQIFSLVFLIYFLAMSTCRGDMSMTSQCASYDKECAFLKAKNCQYYYTYCRQDATQELLCLTPEVRAPFSGRMDVRLLTNDLCTRCAVLEADLADKTDEDEFQLLDPGDMGTSRWRCLSRSVSGSAPKCFDVKPGVWANLGLSCCGLRLSLDLANPANEPFRTCGAAGRRVSEEEAPVARFFDDPILGNRSFAVVTRQECVWGYQDDPSFFFAADACSQPGSLLYLFVLLFTYISGCLIIPLTVIGQAIRVTTMVEPWFVNPRAAHPSVIERFLSLGGP